MVNFETKMHRKLIQELHKWFTENQTRIESDDYRLSYQSFYVVIAYFTAIFQNGGQTVNFRTKVYRKWIKDLHHRFTKNQTRRRLDNCRLRYCGFRLWTYALNLQSNKLVLKMATNRLTLRQKSVGSQLKSFALGLQKVQLDENLITVG